jgi:glutamyl-tRNA synthetase
MPEENQDIRVRFAPSPTGLLHIGGLRTALYNYLFARKHGGKLLLRIEDTDRERYVPDAERDIITALEWVGLEYDEGPGTGGPHAPYRQSERVARYQKYADQLVDQGHAYYAFDTEEELDELRSGDTSRQYDASTRLQMKNSLSLTDEEVQERLDRGVPYVIRLKVPRNETVRFPDIIRDWVSFETAQIDDQVLLKSDGMPTYHLANVVDDHHMEISHVIRGEEWLSSTPKHVLLYRYLGWEMPEMAHLPLILSPAGGKLSKRTAESEDIPVYVREYREAGYEPEALVNFLAFLGWNPGDEREIFTLDELTEVFSLDRVGSSGVQFDEKKLRWYNEQYLRRKSPEDLLSDARSYVKERGYEADDEYLRAVTELMQERISLVSELGTEGAFFFEDPEEYHPDGLKKRWKDDSGALVREYADALAGREEPLTAEAAEEVLRELADSHDVGAGRIIHPTRLAVSGRHYGPSLFHMMEVLGAEVCVRRMRTAVERLD